MTRRKVTRWRLEACYPQTIRFFLFVLGIQFEPGTFDSRAPDGRLHDFRPGVGRLLARFPLRVIPLHIAGAYEAMPTGKHWPRRVPIVIRFGAPIDPRSLVPDLSAADAPERLARALQAAVAGLEAAPDAISCM